MHDCDICGNPSDELQHLPLYVRGSEGVHACLNCRLILCEVARGILRACAVSHKEGWKKAKAVAHHRSQQ